MHPEGKVALLVNAASSDLSWHAAQLLASAGYCLALHDPGASPAAADLLGERVEMLHNAGHETLAMLAELDVPQQLDALLAQLLNNWERLDMVVFAPLSSEITSVNLSFLEATPDSVKRSLRALRALINVQRAAARVMAQHEGGQIIALTDVTRATPYTQAAADAFGDSLRAELSAFGVKVRRLSLAQLGLELLAQPTDVADMTAHVSATAAMADAPEIMLADTMLPKGKRQRSAALLNERLSKDLAGKEFGTGEFGFGEQGKDLSPST